MSIYPKYSRRRFLGNSLVAGALGSGLLRPFSGSASDPADPLWVRPGDDLYASTAVPFNTEIRIRPGLIAVCDSVEAVGTAVRHAAENGMPIAVRSGGHSFVGDSLNAEGIVIDLSQMDSQTLDPSGNYLAGPGVKLKAAYEYLLPRQRLLPAGSCGGVGLGGLTLGGGYGLFAREFGLTCDHLDGVTMVSGRGEMIDSRDDPDLLWACRGGGNGNFGVITSLRFRTQAAPPQLTAQRFKAAPASDAAMLELMKGWFEIAATLPNSLFSGFVMNHREVSILVTSSRAAKGPAFQRLVTQFKSLGLTSKGPLEKDLGSSVVRYFGRPNPLPFRNFSAGYYQGFSDLAPAALEIISEVRSHPGSLFQINTLGGQIINGPDSAYAHRAFPFLGEAQAYWTAGENAKRESLLESSERIRLAIARAGITRHYRNYPSLKFEPWQDAYYGATYPTLQAIKLRYDPENVIRHAQSVVA